MEPQFELSGSSEAPSPEAVPAPSEPVKAPEEATEVTPTEEPAKQEETLYETPDGRKVNADQLTKEWKENFYPEYTRKSQRLAEIEKSKEINRTEDTPASWKNPDYVPKDYAEVIEIAKAEAIRELQERNQKEQEYMKSIQTKIETEISELKKLDSTLDENILFQHANKYGFQDLKAAYTNMTDMKKVALDIEKRTLQNLKTREAAPVAGNTATKTADPTAFDPSASRNFQSATDYLRSLQGK